MNYPTPIEAALRLRHLIEEDLLRISKLTPRYAGVEPCSMETIKAEEVYMFGPKKCTDPIRVERAAEILDCDRATIYRYLKNAEKGKTPWLTRYKVKSNTVLSEAEVRAMLIGQLA